MNLALFPVPVEGDIDPAGRFRVYVFGVHGKVIGIIFTLTLLLEVFLMGAALLLFAHRISAWSERAFLTSSNDFGGSINGTLGKLRYSPYWRLRLGSWILRVIGAVCAAGTAFVLYTIVSNLIDYLS